MYRKLALFIAPLLVVGLIGCSSSSSQPEIEQGVLDLTQWSWERDGEVDLNGDWAFHWGQFIEPQLSPQKLPPADTLLPVPGTWPNLSPDTLRSGTGYGTYSLKVRLPSDSISLSMRVNTASTAMHIWVNGESLYEAGKVATSKQASRPEYCPQIISMPPSRTLDIIIHVSNYHYRIGGLWSSFQLGPSPVIIRQWIWDYTVMAFLVGSFVIMALYHLILYIHRRSDVFSLYFSLFCILVTIRSLSTDLHILSYVLPWQWMLRAELLSFYLCVPVFSAFAQAIYPSVIPQWFVKVGAIGAGIISLIVLLLPSWWATHTVVPFEIFAIGMAAVGMFYTIKASWKPFDGIALFLLGFLGLIIALVNDSLFANNIITTFYVTPFGLFFFLILQSALLSRRFSQAANDLEQINIDLEQRHQQIEEKNDDLVRINQDMDMFVYRTSHDLRAPLTSLLGIISLMRKELLSPDITTYLDLQERSISKLDSFVREILDYSRNSRLDAEPQVINFQTLVDEVYALYTHLPQFEKIDKHNRIHAPVVFMGDIKRLEVVLNNLISNALRYYNPYREDPYVAISVNIDEKRVLIEVEDNGLGIAPEHIDRIFDMFYRASDHEDSSGLGLFLVKETVTKMQGTIDVDSTVNEGTTFVIQLPNKLTEAEEKVVDSAT